MRTICFSTILSLQEGKKKKRERTKKLSKMSGISCAYSDEQRQSKEYYLTRAAAFKALVLLDI